MRINKNYNSSSYSTLQSCLFGAVTLTKNIGIDEYRYSGYEIGFYRKEEFSFSDGFGKNCIIFGVDMSSLVHVDKKKKDILFFGEGPIQGLDGTTLTAEKNIQSTLLKITQKFV